MTKQSKSSTKTVSKPISFVTPQYNMDIDHKKARAARALELLKPIFPDPKTELNYSKPYEFLFAVIMSAQTTDKQVNKVTETLFKKYKTLEDYTKASLEEFQNDIKNIGLYKGKAKNVLATAKILKDQYNGQVPKDFNALTEMPGVARKTANVVTHELYGMNEGIAVDTHVRRLSQQLGLTTNDDPVKIEKDLMELVPKEEWGDFSHRLILYGRYHWPAKAKEHDGPLSEVVQMI